MKKWEYFSKEQLEEFVKESHSYRQLAAKIGYSEKSGSSSALAKEMVEYYHFDTSHFLGAGWNKDNFDYSRFQYGKAMKTESARPALVYKRSWKCEKCGLSTWLDQPIALEIHHKDGNHINNLEENLQLLCPNCHAQTENYRGKNINKQGMLQVNDEDFVAALQKSSSIRQGLLSLGLSGCGANYDRAYKLISQYNISHLKKNK